MDREEVLAYEARRRLYDLIRHEPGLHLRELERRSRLPLSTMRHHLRFLEAHHLIETLEDRNQKRYFSRLASTREDRPLIAALRQAALRRVVLYLLESGHVAAYQDILAATGVPPSTLAVHLAELTKRGVLVREPVGRESRYRVAEPERIIRVLHTYRASFFDALVDHLLAAVYREEPREDSPRS